MSHSECIRYLFCVLFRLPETCYGVWTLALPYYVAFVSHWTSITRHATHARLGFQHNRRLYHFPFLLFLQASHYTRTMLLIELMDDYYFFRSTSILQFQTHNSHPCFNTYTTLTLHAICYLLSCLTSTQSQANITLEPRNTSRTQKYHWKSASTIHSHLTLQRVSP